MKLVFAGGCPRSGTMMLGAILAGSPEVIAVPASDFKVPILKRKLELNSSTVREILDEVNSNPRFKLWEMPIKAVSEEEMFQSRSPNTPDIFTWLFQEYAKFKGKTGSGVLLDRTPNNVTCVQLLLEAFPEAKFLHLVRDGRGVAASVLPLDWGPVTIQAAAELWLKRLSFGLAVELAHPSRVMRVKYEDILSSPDTTIKKICDWTGIPFEQKMITCSGLQVPNYTKNAHKLIGKGIVSGRATAWKKSLTPDQIREFEYWTLDMLPLLDYELEYPDAPPFQRTIWQKFGSQMKSIILMSTFNRFKRNIRMKKAVETSGRNQSIK